MSTGVDIEKIKAIALKAGEAIMQVYARDFEVERKEDKSPLTEADKNANAIILQGLTGLYPNIPYISEESKQTDYSERRDWKRFWLIDPLDGTKEFIKKNGEFTVNIALVENGTPVLGVVYAPAKGLLYWADANGAFTVENDQNRKLEKNLHYSDKQNIVVVGSRSHMSDDTLKFVETLQKSGKSIEFISSGSSLKICLVAGGKADVYPRFGPTMEWDTAAAHAVAFYAGRQVLNAQTRQPLTYNKENLLNPFFIVE